MTIERERPSRIPSQRDALEVHLLRDIRAVGLLEPVREHAFAAPERRWRFDFAWPDRKLAVEVDGGTYSGGRHTRGAGYERDAEKGNEAAIRGWRVLHFTAAMIEDGRALDFIERALRVG